MRIVLFPVLDINKKVAVMVQDRLNGATVRVYHSHPAVWIFVLLIGGRMALPFVVLAGGQPPAPTIPLKFSVPHPHPSEGRRLRSERGRGWPPIRKGDRRSPYKILEYEFFMGVVGARGARPERRRRPEPNHCPTYSRAVPEERGRLFSGG